MKKISFILFGIFIFALFAITVFIQINKPGQPSSTPNISPISTVTPENIPVGAEKPLSVISSQPDNKENNVSLSSDVIISFNRIFSLDEVIFVISPAISYSTAIDGNKLVIKHSQPFSPGVVYTYIIDYQYLKQLPRTRSFTTSGPTQTYQPNTASKEFFEKQDEVQRETHPDTFLANHSPHSTNDFSISSDFKQIPTGHFYFVVTLNDENKVAAKNNFIIWLKSLGLTDLQIQGLDITYY
ncbi:MAG: Ig-like domain-containing protein [Candidatus Levyibacteriota bacterium]